MTVITRKKMKLIVIDFHLKIIGYSSIKRKMYRWQKKYSDFLILNVLFYMANFRINVIICLVAKLRLNVHMKSRLFVAASHQTRLETRSKARRPIKVGIKGRGGRERAETRTLLVCAAHRLT